MTGTGLPLRAWAVVTARDKLLLCDARCPVFWLRRVAVDWAREHGYADGEYRVVRAVLARQQEAR